MWRAILPYVAGLVVVLAGPERVLVVVQKVDQSRQTAKADDFLVGLPKNDSDDPEQFVMAVSGEM